MARTKQPETMQALPDVTLKFQIVRRNVINGRVTTCQCDLGALYDEYPQLRYIVESSGFRSITFNSTYEPEYGACDVTVMPLGQISFETD